MSSSFDERIRNEINGVDIPVQSSVDDIIDNLDGKPPQLDKNDFVNLMNKLRKESRPTIPVYPEITDDVVRQLQGSEKDFHPIDAFVAGVGAGEEALGGLLGFKNFEEEGRAMRERNTHQYEDGSLNYYGQAILQNLPETLAIIGAGAAAGSVVPGVGTIAGGLLGFASKFSKLRAALGTVQSIYGANNALGTAARVLMPVSARSFVAGETTAALEAAVEKYGVEQEYIATAKANGTYEEGKTEREAEAAGDEAFWNNLAVISLFNQPQYNVLYGRGRTGLLGKIGKAAIAALSEGAEELGQTFVNASALGRDPTWQEIRDSAIVGTAMGGIFQTVGHGGRYVADKITGRPSDEEIERYQQEAREARKRWSENVSDVYGQFRQDTTEYQEESARLASRYAQAEEERASQGGIRQWANNFGISDEVFDILARTAQKYDVPIDHVVATAIAESNGDQSVISPVGAIGVMQLMPETAQALGVDPYDVEQNIDGGVRYLKDQYDKFGDWDLAHAAYNAGAGRIEQYGGVPPYAETQEYVRRIRDDYLGVLPNYTGVEESGGTQRGTEQPQDNGQRRGGNGLGVENYDMPPWGNPNISSLKTGWSDVLPQIGGVLKSMGFDPVITSAGRTYEHQMEINPSAPNSWHIIRENGGDAVDISLAEGGVTPEQSQKVLDYFKSTGLFSEVLYHDAGSGLHLHLGGLNTEALDNARNSETSTAQEDAYDNNFTTKENEIWQAVQRATAKANKEYGMNLQPDWIYRQLAVETGRFTSPLSEEHNYGGVKGGKKAIGQDSRGHKYFANDDDFFEAYFDEFIRLRPELKEAKTVEDFARIMKETDYYEAPYESYIADMKGVDVPKGGYSNRKGRQSVSSRADELYAKRMKHAPQWQKYLRDKTRRQEETETTTATEPTKPNLLSFPPDDDSDTTKTVYGNFAKDRMEKALVDEDVDSAMFFRDMFKGNEFQNTPENRAAIADMYGDDFTQFAQSFASPQQNTAQAQPVQATPTPKGQSAPAQSIKQSAGNKFLRNDPVIQAGRQFLNELNKNGAQGNTTALRLQTAISQGDATEVENILKANNRPTVVQQQDTQTQPQQTQQSQQDPVQQNTTPDNVLTQQQQQETPPAKKQQKTGEEKALDALQKQLKPGATVKAKKNKANAILKLADANGIEIPEADRKSLESRNPKFQTVTHWRDNLLAQGILPIQGTTPTSKAQQQQTTAQETAPTFEERANQVIAKATQAAGENWRDFQQNGTPNARAQRTATNMINNLSTQEQAQAQSDGNIVGSEDEFGNVREIMDATRAQKNADRYRVAEARPSAKRFEQRREAANDVDEMRDIATIPAWRGRTREDNLALRRQARQQAKDRINQTQQARATNLLNNLQTQEQGATVGTQDIQNTEDTVDLNRAREEIQTREEQNRLAREARQRRLDSYSRDDSAVEIGAVRGENNPESEPYHVQTREEIQTREEQNRLAREARQRRLDSYSRDDSAVEIGAVRGENNPESEPYHVQTREEIQAREKVRKRNQETQDRYALDDSRADQTSSTPANGVNFLTADGDINFQAIRKAIQGRKQTQTEIGNAPSEKTTPEEAAKRYNERNSTEGGADTRIINLVEDAKLTPQQKFLKDFAAKLGVPIQFFDNPDGRFHGAFSDGSTFLNVNSKKGLGGVFWHENFHWLKANNPKLYQQLVDAAGITDEQRDAFLKRTGRKDLTTNEEIDEEILADQMEDVAKRTGLLQNIAGKNRGLVERVVQWLKDTLNKFIETFRNPQGRLTTAQAKNLTAEFVKMARQLKDADGNAIFRVNSRTGDVEVIGNRTPATARPSQIVAAAHSSNVKYSIDPNDNSNKSFRQRIKNFKQAIFGNKPPTKTHQQIITDALSKLARHKIYYDYNGKTQGDVVVDSHQRAIFARHGYDFEKLLPVVGKQIAANLKLADTDEMSNYIAKWMATGALNDNSSEAKAFAKAMRDNPAEAELLQSVRDSFQALANMTPEEKYDSLIARGEESKSDNGDFMENFIDDLNPIKKFEERLTSDEKDPEIVKLIKDTLAPYLHARLAKGKGAISDMMIGKRGIKYTKEMLDNLRDVLQQQYLGVDFSYFKPMTVIIQDAGGDAKGLERFVLAKLDKEMYEKLREVDKDGNPKYTGLTPSTSEADDDAVIKAGEAKFSKAHEALVNYSNTLAAIQYTSGLITANQFYSMVNGWKNYVPTARVFDEDTPFIVDFKAADSTKQKTGSKRRILSPLEKIAANTEVFLRQAEQNKVKLQVAQMVRFGGYGDVIAETPKGDARGNTVHFRENGVMKYLVTPDKSIVRALEAIRTPADSNVVMQAFKTAGLVMRGLYTMWNFEFAAGNPCRDMPDAFIHNKYGSRNPLVVIPAMVRASFDGLAQSVGLKTQSKEFQEFLAYGGTQSGFSYELTEGSSNRVKDIAGNTSKGRRVWNSFINLMEASENMTRFATYKTALDGLVAKHGGEATAHDKRLAALQARSASVDFARAGKSMRSVNKVFLFSNAAVQSLALWGEKINNAARNKEGARKELFTAFWKTFLGGVVLAIVASAFNYSDDDRRERYKQLQNWEKDNYWNFATDIDLSFLPFMSEHTSIRIPKGMDIFLRASSAMAEEFASYWAENKPVEWKRIMTLFPDGLPSVTTTIVTPLIETWTNYSLFKDAAIVPYGEQNLPAYKQYGKNTSWFAKLLGDKLDYSPRKIDHLIAGYGGSQATWLTGGGDGLPILRRFLFDPDKNPRIVQDYYKALDEQEGMFAEYKQRRKDGEKVDLPEEYDRKLHARLKAAQEPMRNISRMEKKVADSEKLDDDQKKTRLRELEKKRVALCERIFKRAR